MSAHENLGRGPSLNFADGRLLDASSLGHLNLSQAMQPDARKHFSGSLSVFHGDYCDSSSRNTQVMLNPRMDTPYHADTLAHRLRQARLNKRLTQVQLSRLSGVAQADISKVEGGRNLTPSFLLDLAAALEVSPYWLKEGRDQESARWPFSTITPADWAGASDRLRSIAEGYIRGALDQEAQRVQESLGEKFRRVA